MHKPIYLWPFILIYRFFKYILYGIMFVIWLIISSILELLSAIINGFITLSYLVYSFFKLPFTLIGKKQSKKNNNIIISENKNSSNYIKDGAKKVISDKEKKKQEVKLKKQEAKLKKQEEKNKKAEEKKKYLQEQKKKKEEEKLRKQEKELHKNDEILKQKAKEELDRKNKEEQKYIRQLEEKEEKKKKEEEKRKAKEEAKLKRKKQLESDDYKNEAVIIEKKSLNDKLNDFFVGLGKIPSKIKNSIVEKYNNSTFVKNRQNKKDISRQALLIDFDGADAVKSNVKILYEYVAKNQEGKVIKDYFEAFSKVEVHSFLLSEGYEVYSIRTSPWIRFLHGSSSTTRAKIKIKDLIFFTTQLSTYVKAGIPLVESLRILSKQFRNKSYQKIFKAIIYDLTMGQNFSEAMEKQGNAFPKLLINMVKTSEMTGELPEALDDMSEYYTESEKTRKQMITAMMYPSIVFIISIAVSTFIMVYVVPKFSDIYKSMNTDLPGITKAVLGISAFLDKYLVYVLLGIFGIVLLFMFMYKKVTFFRTITQYLLMHTPVIKNVIIYNEVTMFTKTFASLLRHNVFITDSMEILNKITNNEIYKMLILDTITNLAKGEKISKAFSNHWAFPLPAYEMLVTGEKTGQLPEMMQKVSDYYQELHANSVTRIKTFIEPIMIIFLTGIVGVIVLSVVIPMFGMYNSLG